MLEKHLWRDFAAVTFSVAVLGLGLGSTLPLTALVLNARGVAPEVVGWMVAASALGGIAGVRAVARRIAPLTLVVILRDFRLLPTRAAGAAWSTVPQGGTYAHNVEVAHAGAPLFVLGEAWINALPSDAVRGRVVAIYTTSFTLCQVMGPLLTSAVSRFPHSVFLISGAVFLLGAPGIALARDDNGLAEQYARNGSRREKDANASWLAIARKAPAIIAGAAFFAAFDCIVLSFLPLVALNDGFSQDRALTAAAVVMAGDATLQFVAGTLADRFSRAKVQLVCGGLMCVLLPLLPSMLCVPVLWAVYLYLLGGVAGAVYTLSLVASGDYFSGAALLRASGLIALTWNIAGTVGPIAAGVAMRLVGNSGVAAVLWLMAVGFCVVLVRSEGRGAE